MLGKLKTQMKSFEKDHNLLQCYDEITKDQLSKGIIEKAEEKNGNTIYPITLLLHWTRVLPKFESCTTRLQK